jgi:hypothetical protein
MSRNQLCFFEERLAESIQHFKQQVDLCETLPSGYGIPKEKFQLDRPPTVSNREEILTTYVFAIPA